MKIVLNIVAGLLVLLGVVWILQGINVLPGSFMTGQTRWAVYGGIAVAAGIVLLLGQIGGEKSGCKKKAAVHSIDLFMNPNLGRHIRDSDRVLRVIANLPGCFLARQLRQPSRINFDTTLLEKHDVVHIVSCPCAAWLFRHAAVSSSSSSLRSN